MLPMDRLTPALLSLLVTLILSTGCAAQRDLNRGHAAMVAGDPVAARQHFTRALEKESGLAHKRDFAEAYRIVRRDAAVVEGERAIDREEPRKAIERFEQALGYHRGWPAAVAGLDRAHADAADRDYQQALEAADRNELDAARAHLEEALGHRPDHADANAAMTSLTQPPPKPPAAYIEALGDVDTKDWDAALAAMRQTVASVPTFLPARAAIPVTLDAAAEQMLDRGQALADLQKFDEAEAMLRRTLDYRPQHAGFEPALGRVDLARADGALIAGQPGAALLWYRRASEHESTPSAEAGINATTRQIRDAHRLALNLQPESDTYPGPAAELSDRVQQRLTQRESVALDFTPEGRPITLELQSLSLPPIYIRDEPRQHAYDVEYDVPNPDRPHLEYEVSRLDRCIRDLDHRYSRLERQHQSLYFQHSFGPSCGCGHQVHFIHRQLDSVRHDLRGARSDYRSVSYRLSREPHFITRIRKEYWPYTLSTHQRTATLSAAYALPNQPSRSVVASVSDSDTTVYGARPDLGLRENPLDLQTDDELQNELLGRAANRIAHDLAEVLVEQRVDQLNTLGNELKSSDPAAAREARVAAAVLLGALDSSASIQQLNAEP